MRIALLQGHPDPAGGHFCHALAEAYQRGAETAGHECRSIQVSALSFPLLQTQHDFEQGTWPPALETARDAIGQADHVVIVYPLWLGTMPAVLKGFFEQLFRPGFAIEYGTRGTWRRLLKGKSARVVVTMGMPALAYRLWFRAHSLRSLERNILNFVGIGPVRSTLIGLVGAIGADKRAAWLARAERLGGQGR